MRISSITSTAAAAALMVGTLAGSGAVSSASVAGLHSPGPHSPGGDGLGLHNPGLHNSGLLAAAQVAAKAGSGIPDPYYPLDGNLGYNVLGYDVQLAYTPASHSMQAKTTVSSIAMTGLKTFSLDLVGLTVDAVTVDGAAATFTRKQHHELIIRPTNAIPRHAHFSTVVTYHGQPGHEVNGGIDSGWHQANTPGSGFIAGEPHSCTFWYPCNDHPTDKATFRLHATVPFPFAVISNGQQGKTTSGPRINGTKTRTYNWDLTEPTATYLTTIYVDKLTFDRSRLADGTPVVSAYGPTPGHARQNEAKLPEILTVLAKKWGPYPAPEAGGIFIDANIGFSLETFTRPSYTEGVPVATIVHENAHQWWGDNVSVEHWKDVCLNECFASYSTWLWDEHNGANLDARYRQGVADYPGMFKSPLYDMGAGHEFDYNGVYFKGVFFLHALRNKIGDDAFFAALRGIQRDKAGANLSMVGLRNQLEQRTGVDLTSFWRQWVFGTSRPSKANLFPGDL